MKTNKKEFVTSFIESDGLFFDSSLFVSCALKEPSLEAMWERCDRADWMLRLLNHVHARRSLIVLIACDCAAAALPILPPGDIDIASAAIEAARRWVDELPSLSSLRRALRAPYDRAAGVFARLDPASAAAEAAAAVCLAAYSASYPYAASRAAFHARAACERVGRAADLPALVRVRAPWSEVSGLFSL